MPASGAAMTWLLNCIDNHFSMGRPMNLQIRDPEAHALARELAEKRKISMTEAVFAALKAELQREAKRKPLAARAKVIAGELRSRSTAKGRCLSKDEIDEMWGGI